MSVSIYEFDHYKAYLLERIKDKQGAGRGFRARMAEAMGCQVAYVSHVLAGDRDFSLEQAEALTRLFALRPDETEYFFLLVEHARAGTERLKQYFQRQIEQKRENFQQLKARVKLKGRITPEAEAMYYSSWHYQAVRMLVTVKGFERGEGIAQRLRISESRFADVLGFLLDHNILKEEGGKYLPTGTKIHLGSDSPLVSKLHGNWRVHTLGKLDHIDKRDLHYSSVVTLSRADYDKVREIMLKAVLDSHEVVFPSKEECLCVLATDFYEIL